MRTYPTYIEKTGTFTVEDTLCGVLEVAVARTGLEVLTSVVIMAGLFGTISLLSGLLNTGITQTIRNLITAITGV